jgi:AhpD family alkylhydroperoxidase
MTSLLNRTATLTLLAVSLVTSAARAEGPTPAESAQADIAKTLGFVPGFFKQFGDAALPGAWEEMKGLQLNPATALSGRTKELIGVAVAAQIPCKYCVYAHTEFAKLNGATDAELAEAVAVGGSERHWSAYLYGLRVDPSKLRGDVARIVQQAKRGAAAVRTPIVVRDGKTALADIEQTFGFVPEMFKPVPASALPGAWREMKELKLSQSTKISPKNKALIALAVASQVPSEPCVAAETEFAKLGGATDQEIAEAVGIAAITRNMSTMLNGRDTDERAFRADVDRLVAGARKAAAPKNAAR